MSLRQEEQREGPWGWPALQLCAAVLRAQGPLFSSVDIATCLENILMSLPSSHASFSEELQARGRSRVDAEIGECMHSSAPVLLCMHVFQHNESVGVSSGQLQWAAPATSGSEPDLVPFVLVAM